jgi:hypothetical protein
MAEGHQPTFDWTCWGDLTGQPEEVLITAAATELAAIERAEVFILLLPGGYGANAEAGAALALKKPILTYGSMPSEHGGLAWIEAAKRSSAARRAGWDGYSHLAEILDRVFA